MDLRQVNPIGFSFAVHCGFALTATRSVEADRAEGLAAARRALGGAQPALVVDTGARLASRLRPFLGVLDHTSFHRDERSRAHTLAGWAAARVPVVLLDNLDTTTRRLVGPACAHVLENATVKGLRAPESRERLSVAGRRAIDSAPVVRPRWQPAVSIVLVTRRPAWLGHALAQVEGQTYASREVVVVLHGGPFPSDEMIASSVTCPCQVVRAPVDAYLGDALNAGVAASSGEVVTKMDDDDWYGPAHLRDMVDTLDYSGAELVGRGPEFTYVDDIDVTSRREPKTERWDLHVVGGTLTMRVDDLRRAGGWPRLPRGVDKALIAAVRAAGGRTYRTHGYSYLRNRHGDGHTWETPSSYFLARASFVRPGLDLRYADCLPAPAPTDGTSGHPSPGSTPGSSETYADEGAPGVRGPRGLAP